jgi:hypothetical protein
VRGLEPLDDLREDRDRFVERHRPARDPLGQRVSPDTSSITRNRVSPAASKPWRVAMFGWLSEASRRASRSKRASSRR